eukprot:TRINITY_DN5664_c0_g1_i1.p1 TRINITY_DN5664_c0_g1~~TRINITY_DN5664_c0_g1_i1.p1  ORF type:complete len:425 (+),score=90.98 TRINITY_DN5664_c0_g1_i1:157-1431(+)
MDTNDVLSSALGNSTRATLQDTLARVEYEASSEADREKEEETIIHPHEVTDFMPEVDDNETLLDDWNPDDPQNPFARQEAPQEEVEEMSAMLQSFNGELPDFRLPTGALLILPESGPISVASAGSVQLTLSSDGITRGVSVSALTESVQPHCFDVGKAEGSPGQGDALQQYIEQETCLEGIVSSEQVSKLSRLNRLRGSHDGVPFTVLLPNGRIELQMQPYTQDLLTLKVIEAKIAAQVESPHPAVSLQSASAPGYSSRGSSYTPLGATISVVTNHLGVGTLEGLLHVHVIKRPLWVISIMSSDFPPCITAALDRCAAKHLYLDAQDGPNTLLSVVLADCVRFFLDAHACGAFVYVHCVAGVNRSVTVGTALLMLCYRLGLKEASSLLHCLRDTSVLLNQQFCMELAALDHGLAAGWHCEALSD